MKFNKWWQQLKPDQKIIASLVVIAAIITVVAVLYFLFLTNGIHQHTTNGSLNTTIATAQATATLTGT